MGQGYFNLQYLGRTWKGVKTELRSLMKSQNRNRRAAA